MKLDSVRVTELVEDRIEKANREIENAYSRITNLKTQYSETKKLLDKKNADIKQFLKGLIENGFIRSKRKFPFGRKLVVDKKTCVSMVEAFSVKYELEDVGLSTTFLKNSSVKDRKEFQVDNVYSKYRYIIKCDAQDDVGDYSLYATMWFSCSEYTKMNMLKEKVEFLEDGIMDLRNEISKCNFILMDLDLASNFEVELDVESQQYVKELNYYDKCKEKGI